MGKLLKYCLAASALALAFSAVSVIKRSSAALAQSDTYVADTSSQVAVSSLVNGARYLLCQYSSNTSKYEVLNGSTTSTKQIPFLAPDYSSLADLQNGASSVASRYVTLVEADEANHYWYIRRSSDNYYFSSNGSSDLVFSSSNVYSSDNRTYFVPSVGGSSNVIRFSISSDTALYLGTKVEGAYFDTWHDGSSVAAKDFILYRVYNQDEEATNYASSFDSSVGATCDINGNTALGSLRSVWANMWSAWSALSSPAQTLIKNATPNSDAGAEEIAKCKAKYLYIVSKYQSDPLINDFMGLGTESLIASKTIEDGNDWELGSLLALLLLGVSGGLFALTMANRRKKTN